MEILSKNSFPRALIDRSIKSFLDKRFSPTASAFQEAKKALLFCMPYLGRYSSQIKTKIRRIKQCYPGIQLQVIFRSPKRIQLFFHLKIAFLFSYTPQLFTSFSVLTATPHLVLWKTSRNLIARCKEHLGINKAGQKIKVSPSTIWDHINQSGHAASLEEF